MGSQALMVYNYFADCLDFLSLLLAVWQFTVEWPTGRAHKGATWGSCFDVVENYPCTKLIACNVFYAANVVSIICDVFFRQSQSI